MPRATGRRAQLRTKRSRDEAAADADTPVAMRKSRFVSEDAATAARALDFEGFEDTPASRSRTPGSQGVRAATKASPPAPRAKAGASSSSAVRAASAAALALTTKRGRRATGRAAGHRGLAKALDMDDVGPDEEEDDAINGSPASAKRPRRSPGSPSTAVPARTLGRQWPEGMEPDADLLKTGGKTSVRDVMDLSGALVDAFSAALPRVNGLAMQNLEAVSARADSGKPLLVKAAVEGSRSAFLSLFSGCVVAAARARAPVKHTGFAVFARSDSTGRKLGLKDAASRWALLTAKQKAVYAARAEEEHAQAAEEAHRRMESKGLEGELDLTAAALRESTALPTRVAAADADSASTSSASRATPPRSGARAAGLATEDGSVLGRRRNALLKTLRAPFATNRPLYTALTVSGHQTLFATLTPRLSVTFSPTDGAAGEEERGTIALSAKVLFRWGDASTTGLEAYAVAAAASSAAAATARPRRSAPTSRSSAAPGFKPTAKRGAKPSDAIRRGKAGATAGTSLAEMAASFGLARSLEM